MKVCNLLMRLQCQLARAWISGNSCISRKTKSTQFLLTDFFGAGRFSRHTYVVVLPAGAHESAYVFGFGCAHHGVCGLVQRLAKHARGHELRGGGAETAPTAVGRITCASHRFRELLSRAHTQMNTHLTTHMTVQRPTPYCAVTDNF